jgi:hypothetical protein
LQNRQSAINTTLPSRAVHEGRSGEELVAQFARWAAGQRAADAVDRRARERSLRDQAVGSATLVGVLVDLAERSASVALLAGAQRLRGRLVGVGRDFCVLEQPSGRPTLIALSALGSLTVASPAENGPGGVGRVRPPGGDRDPGVTLTMAAALSALAEERSPAALVLVGGHQEEGTLIGAGVDVVTVRTDGQPRRLVHIPFAAICICEPR